MATKTDNTIQMSNSTDALFRAWATFIHDLIKTTGGWTNTSDTGQVDLTTVTAPAAADTKKGYKIYAMADALQGASPLFMRLDFGSGAVTNQPGVWITIGTGSNGSGTITGVYFNGGATTSPTVENTSNAATATNNYGSAATNRVAVMMGITNAAAARMLTFTVERTKDSSGADTGQGAYVFYYGKGLGVGTTSPISRCSAPYSGVSNPLEEVGLAVCMTTNSPSAFSSDVGIGIPFPFRGISQPPGTNQVVVINADWSAEASFTMTLYGVSLTFTTANAGNTATINVPGTSGAANNSNIRWGIRFD
jgi:hypothetical protein